MSDAPERIWIDAWGGNWSPRSGGTQEIEYIRADRIEALTKERDKAMQLLKTLSNMNGDLSRDMYETKLLLEKAVEALREIAGECGCSTARATLAEIEGEKE